MRWFCFYSQELFKTNSFYFLRVNNNASISLVLLQRIEENNRLGKTRDLFKKIRDTKGTYHAKKGTIKDNNSMDLTEAEDIKKTW